MRQEMTRYSKNPDKQNRKNTLVTITDGETIFFGISRCNVTAGDKFLKAKGRGVARGRALKAQEEFPNSSQADGTIADLNFVTHSSGLRGFVQQDRVPELLEYFRNIDENLRNTSSGD